MQFQVVQQSVFAEAVLPNMHSEIPVVGGFEGRRDHAVNSLQAFDQGHAMTQVMYLVEPDGNGVR